MSCVYLGALKLVGTSTLVLTTRNRIGHSLTFVLVFELNDETKKHPSGLVSW